ncbi:hypothetical protein DOTSEDRAFT_26183 [Dothistroma septosporum NZE10]|uniref:Uncharacterized protein n=1 Tax=Dothistroma septosporum (strain NZE10 / CBS 128990) TaxID=675120 RepID=N1PKH8_DOTSN|nr:hypothetical protein DOTSEDRAFT_26183 [Dothistroma septosporum NZE10]
MESRPIEEKKRLRDRFSKAMGRKRSESMVKKHVLSFRMENIMPETSINIQEAKCGAAIATMGTSEQYPTSGLLTQYPKASLLGIPGELRNQIYGYVLLEGGLVKLDAQDHQLPGLLRTCRQIRDEATEIYQTENNFQVDAWNMKLCIPQNYADHWMSTLEHSHFWITMRGTPNWENFMVWLKRYSTGEVPGLASGQPTDEAEILAQAFEIVHSMKALLSIDQTRPVLDAWKRSVILAGANLVFP